jgi:phosphopantothenoylcysteine decarboxylase/phosphopantothenate--cysteine ligase
MRSATMGRLEEASIVVMTAAVSDYRVKQVAEQKLKRDGARVLELEPTEDILREVVARKPKQTLVIGFAAETENVLANGRAKLERKGVDAIVINDVSSSELGFDSERNAGTFLTHDRAVEIPAMNKTGMAGRILDEVVKLRASLPSAVRGA